MKKIIKSEKAQALVEFTLIMPIIIVLILGMIEFGWLLNAKITLNSAAREGARVGAVLLTTDVNRKTKVINAAQGTIDQSGISLIYDECTVTYEDDDVENIHNIVVVLKGNVKPIIGLFVTGNVKMTATVRMRRE